MNRTQLSALALIAAGAALGYVAASSDFRLLRPATAANPPARLAGGAEGGGSRSEGLDQGVLLAQAVARTASAERPRENAAGSAQKPNIVVIMGDDVGWFNIGAYHRGMMAGKTPHLDQLATQGMLFTDYYAEPSCTAGRANFITGQFPIRTGLTTVGQAGAKVGMPAAAPTIATALRSMGYATGQFGKNHLGDLNEYLPTVHGFDEFYSYLYHLDAMEDPAFHSYPPELKDKVGPRNMIHSWVTAIFSVDSSTTTPWLAPTVIC
jgi:Sulfatase